MRYEENTYLFFKLPAKLEKSYNSGVEANHHYGKPVKRQQGMAAFPAHITEHVNALD